MRRCLETAADVITVLGGCKKVSLAIGTTAGAISNMKQRNRISANYYAAFTRELARLGYSDVPPNLFNQQPYNGVI